ERPDRPPPGPPEQGDQTDDPTDREDRTGHQHEEQPHHDPDRPRVALAESGADLELGPPVRSLVDDRREREQAGEPDAAPQPARAPVMTAAENREAEPEAHEQHDDEELVGGARADDGPDGEPPAPVVPEQGAHREEERGRPDHEVETRD